MKTKILIAVMCLIIGLLSGFAVALSAAPIPQLNSDGSWVVYLPDRHYTITEYSIKEQSVYHPDLSEDWIPSSKIAKLNAR
jgi:hypothetical protein